MKIQDQQEPLIVFSQDTHINPRSDNFRPYCPKAHLQHFDEFTVKANEAYNTAIEGTMLSGASYNDFNARSYRNLQSEGNYEIEARFRDLNRDGVAAALLLHGGGVDPFPLAPMGYAFGSFVSEVDPSSNDLELLAVGIRIYNRWLADALKIEPGRNVGSAHVPVWDPDATLAEIKWARNAGIQSITWPVARPGMVEYDDPAWEPIWAECAEQGIVLNTHAAGEVPGLYTGAPGPHQGAIMQLEGTGWQARRGLPRMVLSGVFERHPKLKMAFIENGYWWWQALIDLDIAYDINYDSLKGALPRRPSEYCRSNVYNGVSFMAPFEAKEVVERGWSRNFLWGSDYPHPEGSWKMPDSEDEPVTTRLHLRDTFCDIPENDLKLMIGENAIDLYGLDRSLLQDVAKRIDAPTLEELRRPLTELVPGVEGFKNPVTSGTFHKIDPKTINLNAAAAA